MQGPHPPRAGEGQHREGVRQAAEVMVHEMEQPHRER